MLILLEIYGNVLVVKNQQIQNFLFKIRKNMCGKHTAQKRIFSVNVIQPAKHCGFGYIC